MTLRGFDASSVQGHLPFDAVAQQGLSFGIFKAYQGNDFADGTFSANVAGAQAAGLEPFGYCFAYPLPGKAGVFGRLAKEQAKVFVDRVWSELPNRPIFLDLEWPAFQDWHKWGCTAQSISDWCAECAEQVTLECCGIRPVLYTYPFWWAQVSHADTSWAADYGLWIASYVTHGQWPGDSDAPVIPHPWTDWKFWQFDGDGGLRLPNGVDSDFCLFNGDGDALAAFARGA